MASHEAARRAVAAGYKNVAVMSDGIQGWADMHQPVRHVSESEADSSAMAGNLSSRLRNRFRHLLEALVADHDEGPSSLRCQDSVGSFRRG